MSYGEHLELKEARGILKWVENGHLYAGLDTALMEADIPFEKFGHDIWVYIEDWERVEAIIADW